jgi:hypothetical protein
MITCSPWNPVAMKNVDPKDESRIENGASTYSNPWSAVNSKPRVTVSLRDNLLALRLDVKIAWCAHVTVTPEDKSNRVFSSGMFIGSNGITPLGGQLCPSSMFGEILL